MIVAKPIPVGSRLIDSLPFSQSDGHQAAALRASGVEGVALYLGVASAACVEACYAAGLGVVGVTLAQAPEHYDGHAAVAHAKAMGLASGTSLFLDVEGPTVYKTPPNVLIPAIDKWADEIAPDFLPGIYLGSPQPLTQDELTALHVVRYWRAPARVVDRFGKSFDGPAPGWCMFQGWPQMMWRDSGVFVDVDFVYEDFRGRVPVWSIAA